jgi:hypothetical protein
MKRKAPKQPIQTAFHEAGHAVAFHELGFKVKSVTIVPDEESLGKVYLETRALHLRDLEYFYNEAIGSLAAEEAVKYYDPRYKAISERDRQEVVRLLMHTYNHDPRSWGYVEAKAKALVRKPSNWRKIKRVAKALVEKKTLHRDELLALLK